MVMGVCLRHLFKILVYMWTFVCSELGQGTMGCSEECCFGVMYGEWHGVCDYIVLSVVEVCADYSGVNVFHDCLNFGGSYGVGVCIHVCIVVCFLRLGVVCCVVM